MAVTSFIGAVDKDEDIVLTIVRERGTRDEFELVERWHRAFVDAGEDPGASADAGSFADLKELLACVPSPLLTRLIAVEPG